MMVTLLIAIVDDDEGVRTSLEGLIRSLGYRAAAFSSAEAFLASAARHEARCVISDVSMPGGIDGFALTRWLSDTGFSGPVILISAFSDETIVAAAEQAGAFCLLKKPFDGEALIDCIERAVSL